MNITFRNQIVNEKEFSLDAGYKTPNNHVAYVYGKLVNKNVEANIITKVFFQYAPANYHMPFISKMTQNGIEKPLNEQQKKGFAQIIKGMVKNNIVGKDSEQIKKTLFAKKATNINTESNSDFIPNPEGLDVKITESQQEAAPTIEEKDNRDEVIKKLLEENAKLREENKRLKDIINKNSKAKEEVVVTATEAFNADKLMAAMRKEFDKKLESLRKEMMDKLNTTTVVTTKVEEPKAPVIEAKKEEKPKALTAQELLDTKELDDMTFQELQKIGKYFKIGAANNSPRPQLIEILKQHINPVIEEKEPEITKEVVVDTTITNDTNTDSATKPVITKTSVADDFIPDLCEFEELDTEESDINTDDATTTDDTKPQLTPLQQELLAKLQSFNK